MSNMFRDLTHHTSPTSSVPTYPHQTVCHTVSSTHSRTYNRHKHPHFTTPPRPRPQPHPHSNFTSSTHPQILDPSPATPASNRRPGIHTCHPKVIDFRRRLIIERSSEVILRQPLTKSPMYLCFSASSSASVSASKRRST
jgi:hypothetical protein